MVLRMNWQELSATSHYQTAVAIKQELAGGNTSAAATGIEELIEALGRSEKRALRSQLVRLMAHVIKWKSQPEKRSRSWIATIYNARDEIADIQEEVPGLTDSVIRAMWDKCFRAAKREAEAEISQPARVTSLTWQEVVEDQYSVS